MPFFGNIIRFIVCDDNTINCPALGVYSCRKMELKPRFVMWCDDGVYEYNAPVVYYEENLRLIGRYKIDKKLFEYLKQRGMIQYSNDMAYFYDFEDKRGFDSEPGKKGVGSPFKWAKKKGPILVRQRRGEFN